MKCDDALVAAPKSSSRNEVIGAVRTPLGFFSLALLVAEAILGIVAARASGTDRTLCIVGMLVVMGGVIGIVTWLARAPDILGGGPDPRKLAESVLLKSENESLKEVLQRLSAENSNLKASIERVSSENHSLKLRLEDVTTWRLQILGLLGQGSTDVNTMFRELRAGDGEARTKVLSEIGRLVEEGTIEADTFKPHGYYRLVKKTS